MRYLFAALFCFVLAGCNSSGLKPVEGVVLLDGNPLPSASIQFVPQGKGKNATGVTDSEGKFAMSTVDPRDGVQPGSYKVVVVPLPKASAPQQFASADEAMRAAARPQPKVASTFPQKYTRPDLTPLVVEVPLKEKKITLELKSN